MWSCYVTSTIKRLVLLFSLCCRNKIDCTHLIRISIVISSSTLLKMRHCHAIFHSIKFEKMLYDDSMHYDLHQTYYARVRKKSSFKGVLWQPIMIMMYVKSDKFCLLYWKREVVYHCSVLTDWLTYWWYNSMYELLKFEKSFNYRSMYGCFVIYFVNLMFAIKEDIEIILLF